MNKNVLILALAALSPLALRADLKGLASRFKKTVEETAKGRQADLAKLAKSGQELAKDITALTGVAKVYPDDTKVSFEVKNKSEGRIGITIDNPSGQRYSKDGISIFQVESGETLSLEPPLTSGLIVSVIETKGIRKFTTPAGKTAYLTWDGNTLRPQTGPAGGALNKTDTGLSLGKNVRNQDVLEDEFEEETSTEFIAAIARTKELPPPPTYEQTTNVPLPPPLPGAVSADAA